MAKDFVDTLKASGKLKPRDVKRAQGLADATSDPLHLVLCRLGLVTEEDMAEALKVSLGLPLAGKHDYPSEAILVDRLTPSFLRTCRVLPLAEENGHVVVAMADPLDDETVRALQLQLGKPIERRVAVPVELERQIARLYDQTRHLARLVEDLHELAQAEAQQLSLDIAEVDAGELIQETAAFFDSMLNDEGVSLQVDIEDNLPILFADRARLMQGIQNLLSNALRFTPAGGSIRVQGIRAAGGVSIAVSDTGAGIDPQHVAHVFDRFYRSDEARSRDSGGSGLGLAIVKAIVEAHGGTIELMSAPGEGAEFVLTIPKRGAQPRGRP